MNQSISNKFKSTVFKALSASVRLEILNFLKNGEKCVCEIVPHIGFAQPTVSRHLKVLVDCGILKSRKDGNNVLYDVTDKKIYEVIEGVDSALLESLSKALVSKISE